MRAYQVTSTRNSKLCNIDPPNPRPNQVRICIAACGLNFADLLMIKGTYQKTPPTPFTLGLEISGTVDQLGTDAPKHLLGKRVAVYSGQGGLAEFGCFPADACLPIPDNMTFEQAAGFQIAYGTSHLALDHRARLQPGETLLILGAAGGVGLTAVELGKRMGATVIACARGPERLSIAQHAGADHLIDTDKQDIRTAVKALGGADVVYDPVGGTQYTAAFRACKPDARYVLIGFASGNLPEIRPNHILVKNITVIGLNWGGYLDFAPDRLRASLSQLMTWFERGELSPHISHTLSLDQADTALNLLRSRKALGKIVVTPEAQPAPAGRNIDE